MDDAAVLAAFEQLRRNPAPDTGGRVEQDLHVTRHLSGRDGWNGVIWSDLDATNADATIAEQLRQFASVADSWEWKYYSYDQPPDLPRRLVAAGFTPQPEEALMVARIEDLDLGVAPPAGVVVRPVVDDRDIAALVSVHDQVFGDNHAEIGRAIRDDLTQEPRTMLALVAWAGDTPVSAARVQFHHGTEFASIWGGGTLPTWRRRGIFRALVARRAAEAASRGFRYLQVDASDDSRPILRRLGFAQLATTTPFIHSAGE